MGSPQRPDADRSTDRLPPRSPVLVGVGQVDQRVDRGAPSRSPDELMAEALRRAGDDAGAAGGRLLAAADTICVVKTLSWRYRNPGALVAAALGASPRRSVQTTDGGNSPQLLVNRAALDIQEGRADVVLITGAEAWRTRTALRKGGDKPDWPTQDESVPEAEVVGSERPLSHPNEVARGLFMPVQIYPLFESAVAAASGRSLAEHRAHLARLWSGFSQVAATNPHAWVQRAFTPDEVGTVSPDNRMIGFPYPKLMNANNSVEQAAGLVLCSVERARDLGIPTDRWVFPQAGTDAHDTPFVSHRRDLRSSPAIAAAGRVVLELAGTAVDEVEHVDLYSCFPSAVQVAADELGTGFDRPLTVTGGLSFAGGPWNDYVTHAIAAMADRVRADPASTGLVTANGGYLTKHAFGVYRTRPPASGRFEHACPQDEVDAAGSRELCEEHDGPVTIEAGTVLHDRSGAPEYGLAAVLLDDGRRAWGRTEDAATMAAMEADIVVGRPAHLAADGALTLT